MLRNIAKCKKCGDIIESKSRHDFVECSCGAIFVDGGHDYIRRGGDQFDEEFDRQNGYPVFDKSELESEPKTLKPAEEMTYDELSDFTTVFGQEVMQMCTLTKKVWEWFDEKGLKDPMVQFVKMEEECGELAHELTRGRTFSREIVDALGDILVTVIGMCHHLHITPQAALTVAYNEIKNRKGKVVEGSFVKNE